MITSKSKKSKNFLDLIAQELWEISNPVVTQANEEAVKLLEKQLFTNNKQIKFNKNSKVFLPSKKYYQDLVTSRNKNLVTQKQQNLLEKTVVAFFGLSVGSHAATTWMMLSRADSIKISDPDIISPTNLNRLRFAWDTIGRLKVDVVKQQLEGINPYCNVYKFKGSGSEVINKIILDKPKPDIIVDSMDDLKSKVLVRLLAKEIKIPVLMATDVGDNVFLDIERYDKNPQPMLFNGRVKNVEKIDLSHITNRERIKLSMQIVGLEHNSNEMLESLLSIGKTIRTWPQLGSTATLAGGLIASVIKKIVLGEKVESGRYYLSLDDLLVEGFNSKKRVDARKILISELSSILD